jgi:hypothetical protein
VSAVRRFFAEWLAQMPPAEDWASGDPDEDDLYMAFEAGWASCYQARWEPVGGLPSPWHERKGVEPR